MLRIICNILMTIIIIILAALAALLLVPRALGYQSMAVLSGSMEPGIPVGSIVFVKEVEPETLAVGDVISYQISGDTMVTHRIVGIDLENQEVTTQGDANDTPDGQPVSFQSIVGKMGFSLPFLGYLSIYIRTPIGIAAGCGLLIVLIILGFLPGIFSREEEENLQRSR